MNTEPRVTELTGVGRAIDLRRTTDRRSRSVIEVLTSRQRGTMFGDGSGATVADAAITTMAADVLLRTAADYSI